MFYIDLMMIGNVMTINTPTINFHIDINIDVQMSFVIKKKPCPSMLN